MKRFFLLPVLAGFALGAETKLPKLELSTFAPVPPRIATPGDAFANDVEPTRPTLAAAANADLLLDHIGLQLTAEQRALLDRQLFILVDPTGTKLETIYEPPPKPKPGEKETRDYRSTDDEMLRAFARIGDEWGELTNCSTSQAKLVTPDVFLHAWHRYFNNSMEVVEQQQLRPRLDGFLAGAIAAAAELRESAPPAARPGLDRLRAQLSCAWVLLGTEKPLPKGQEGIDESVSEEYGEILPKADPRTLAQRLEHAAKSLPPDLAAALRAEVALVMGAKGQQPSPLFAVYGPPPDFADYSQFIVRSHYTKTPELSAYFRSMMFLGRNGIPLPGRDDRGLSDSILLLQVLAHTPKGAKAPPLKSWREIMEITSFFAGMPDDICWPELRDWLAAASGKSTISPAEATDPAFLAKLEPALKNLRQPEIVSSLHDTMVSPDADPPSFRIFGQRFNWTGWVFSELTRGSPKTAPSMVTGPFVFAAFGDPLARRLSMQFVADNPVWAATIEKRLGLAARRLSGVPDADWFTSMAGKQLHVLTRLAGPANPHWPGYMRGTPYAARNLEAMLGSWTELKHDTVLYAKQSYAELGEGGQPVENPPIPFGFVEPRLAFWAELERLATFAADGFARHHLLPDAGEEWSRLGRFKKDVALCRTLATLVATGKPLTAKQYLAIWRLDLRYMDEPILATQEHGPDNGMTALVTDVHTDGASEKVLLEALGKPAIMLALVGTGGHTRLTAGMVYRHFEFTAPIDKRMTDEAWRAKVYSPTPRLPARAQWAVPVLEAPVPKAKPVRQD